MNAESRAYAKINLGLHVLDKRLDGYHDIETVLVRIDWSDRVTVAPADRLSMTCSDPHVPVDEGNTCIRAARLLSEHFGIERGAAIHLEKLVPYGAGLGSASSDAATTLQLLTSLWRLDVSSEQLLELAGMVGSDVPFFLHEGPCFSFGRGTSLRPLYCSQEPFHLRYAIAVVVPPVHVSTAVAYGMVTPRNSGRPNLERLVCADDPARWSTELRNDFEQAQLEEPQIASARDVLQRNGALYASLSGSGSAVYGIFETLSAARSALGDASISNCRRWSGFAVTAQGHSAD